jgi:hypothetical protein
MEELINFGDWVRAVPTNGDPNASKPSGLISEAGRNATSAS